MADLEFSGRYQPLDGLAVVLEFAPLAQDDIRLALAARAAPVRAVISTAPVLDAGIQAIAPSARAELRAVPVIDGKLAAIAAGRMQAPTAVDINVWRGLYALPAPGWQPAQTARPAIDGPYQDSDQRRARIADAWQTAGSQCITLAASWGLPPRLRAHRDGAWAEAIAMDWVLNGPSRWLRPRRGASGLIWEVAQNWAQRFVALHQDMCHRRGTAGDDWRIALARSGLLLSPCHPGIARWHWLTSRHQFGRLIIGPGRWLPWPVDPQPPEYVGSTDLAFDVELLPCRLNLDFALRCCDDGPDVILAMRTYLMTATVILARERDGLEIPVLAAAVSLDAGTALWGVDVTLPEAALRDLSAREVMRLSINGHEVLWLAERWSRSRQFGGARAIRMTGRSVHAELDAPLWPAASGVVSAPTNARQLADQALEMSGYTVDWKLPDWLVPAGAWSWEQMTPLARVARLAEAAGGTVIGAPDTRQLLARPLYSAAPWAWGSAMPQLQLPEAVLETLSEDWDETPAIDSVIVTGERAGVIARVKRAGTAGANVGETIIDPLVTDAAAASARGLNAIAQSGRSCRVSISLPVFSDTRLALPGDLVAVTGGDPFRAMVRGVRISAERRGALVVRQTLDMERRA